MGIIFHFDIKSNDCQKIYIHLFFKVFTMIDMRSIALVGRPNVGKSRLFNRLVKRRISIVHDQPGVTRDIITAEVDNHFTLMDTGGISLAPKHSSEALFEAVEEKITFALQASSLIIFVVDGTEGCTTLDEIIAEKLHSQNKHCLLAINKIDNQKRLENLEDFSVLGFKEPALVSAEHGLGIDELLKKIKEALGPEPVDREEPQTPERIKISLVGRPNVGKSSIGNRLLNSKRLIVSDVPGTTRDTVESDLEYTTKGGEIWRFRLADTAGMRYRNKIKSSVEYFSSVRTHRAIENSDIVFLVLDATQGVTQYDKALAGKILKEGRALAIIVNKWDLVFETFAQSPLEGYKNEIDFRQKFTAAIQKNLFFLPESPIIFISATSGYALHNILIVAHKIFVNLFKKLPTPRVNRLLAEMITKRTPRPVNGKRFKLYYALQTGNRAYTIRLFSNRQTVLEDSYLRYLQAGFIKEFGIKGCPVQFEVIGK